MIINIAKEFTKTPGGRSKDGGEKSGEEFRDKILKRRYLAAKERGEILTVVLDGGYGYSVSFLEEAFGGLAREIKDYDLLNIIIVSDQEPALIERVNTYIREALD